MAGMIQHDEPAQVKLVETARGYRDGYNGIQRVLDSLLAIQELADGGSDQGLILSSDARLGLVNLLAMLGRAGDDCLGKMPHPQDFPGLLGTSTSHGGYAQ